MSEELQNFLVRTPFFAGLTGPALQTLEKMLVHRRLPAQAHVFEEGDQGASLFVLRRGTAVVWQRGAPGEQPIKLTRLHPGDFFGEMTLIEMQPRSATVITESETELLELRAQDLYALYKADIKAYVMVLQNTNRELCRRLRRTNARLVEWASDAEDETTQVGLPRVR
jgi:CRP/FNR family cyclic AMP-dependent transcriptional regulator